ncbi:hypothetical protein G4B88_024046 [Cannabis sativa]|uniref:Uncharacterized protein n=1 Tax=Cannabis sativa TaxID=3483 RepID=A0A7J6ENR6_CANSA|nr:hypothetical protein G4B88_024046 [Cannabis sativa]
MFDVKGRSCVASVAGEDAVGDLGRTWPSSSASRGEDAVVSVVVQSLGSERVTVVVHRRHRQIAGQQRGMK